MKKTSSLGTAGVPMMMESPRGGGARRQPELTYLCSDRSGGCFEYKEEGGQDRSRDSNQGASVTNPGEQ